MIQPKTTILRISFSEEELQIAAKNYSHRRFLNNGKTKDEAYYVKFGMLLDFVDEVFCDAYPTDRIETANSASAGAKSPDANGSALAGLDAKRTA